MRSVNHTQTCFALTFWQLDCLIFRPQKIGLHSRESGSTQRSDSTFSCGAVFHFQSTCPEAKAASANKTVGKSSKMKTAEPGKAGKRMYLGFSFCVLVRLLDITGDFCRSWHTIIQDIHHVLRPPSISKALASPKRLNSGLQVRLPGLDSF